MCCTCSFSASVIIEIFTCNPVREDLLIFQDIGSLAGSGHQSVLLTWMHFLRSMQGAQLRYLRVYAHCVYLIWRLILGYLKIE
jgi:hypothetical protein